VKLAKRMKKNNISIDIISFGDIGDENIKKLQAFNENIKGGDGSHLEIIPPGPNLLSDSILATPVLAGDGVGGGAGGVGESGAGGAGETNQFEFGVNPELDPELALALRMSYEEEKARQEKETKAREEAEKREKEKLEGIPEADEKQPLLDQNGEASEVTGSASTKGTDKKDKPDDADKMDTA
jgi:26S proteasome regulatory subunit N10